MDKILALFSGNILYPAIMTSIGLVVFVGTSAASAVGMDSALEFSNSFGAYGPMAKLFVASLSLSVFGIVWWAKSNERRFLEYQRRLTDDKAFYEKRLAEHKANNEKITAKLFAAMQAKIDEGKQKDEVIADLVSKLKITDLD